jgi:hypothetical protein
LIDSLALSVVVGVIVARVVVSGVVVLLLSSELLGSGSLSLGVEILDLGLTEDAIAEAISMCVCWKESTPCLHVGVAGGGLVDFWVVDDKKDLDGAAR